MTDTNTTPPATGPAQQGAPIVGQTDGSTPAPITQVPANPLDGMTPEQIDALAARVEEARRNRPASLADQLAALQASITETAQAKDEKVEARKTARDEADTLEAQLSEIRNTLRKTELIEAATAAGFKAPHVVAEMLAKSDGDIMELVKNAAASGAYVMNAPKPSADVGGQGSQIPNSVDAGRAGLMAEIKAAQGR